MPTEKTQEPNYKKLYQEEHEKSTMLANRCTEYEKLCKAYAEKTNQTQELLKQATLEYNAKIDYMLDCVKHAYISIQMARNTTQGEQHNGN